MRTFDSATAAYLDGRGDIVPRYLVWMVARDRSTGDPAPLGLWTGQDARIFTVEGDDRAYAGGLAVLQVPPVEGGVGLDVRQITLSLSNLDPAVLNLIRSYDARRATIEIHRLWLSLDGRQQVGTPVRMWRGRENGTGVDHTAGTVSAGFVSDGDRLTRGQPIYKSAAALTARAPTDTFRAYADIAAATRVSWGEGNWSAGGAPAPIAPAANDGPWFQSSR